MFYHWMGPHYERGLLAGRRTYLPLSRTALTQQFWVRAPKFRRPCKLHQRRAKSAAVGVTASLIGSDQFSVLRNYVLVSHYPFLGDVFLVDLAAALKLTKKSAMRACVEKFQRSARPHCRQKCPPTGDILRLAVCLVWPRCARTPQNIGLIRSLAVIHRRTLLNSRRAKGPQINDKTAFGAGQANH